MISQLSFNLPFPEDIKRETFFHMLINHLYIFSGKDILKSLAHF